MGEGDLGERVRGMGVMGFLCFPVLFSSVTFFSNLFSLVFTSSYSIYAIF